MKIDRKQLIRFAIVILLAVGIYGILPQFGSFKGSFHLIRQADVRFALEAVAASFATYVFAGFIYCSLAIKPLSYMRTFMVQLAAMFINRLLPAGIGALGSNAAYLRKNKHTLTQSAVIVSLNNLLGMLGHALLLLLTYLFWRDNLSFASLSGKKSLAVGVVFVLALIVGISILIFSGSSKVKHLKEQIKQMLSYYKDKPYKLVFGLIGSMCLTLSFVICLWFSLKAVGLDISLPACLILLTLGVGAGTAIPTPGGLGGVEAGIYGGLIAFHAASTPALAGVLLFRLASYWLPLLVGALALVYVQNKGWLGSISGSAQSGSRRKQ